MSETTSQVAALVVDDEAISERIKHKSREMQKFHRDLRKRIEEESDPALAKCGSGG